MQDKLCWRVAYKMPVVFRIMSTVEGPRAIAKLSMNITGFIQGLVFSKYQNFRLDVIFDISGCLPHKTPDNGFMALAKHGGHRVPLS